MAVIREMSYGRCRICVHDDAVVQTCRESRELIGEAVESCGKKLIEIRKEEAPLS